MTRALGFRKEKALNLTIRPGAPGDLDALARLYDAVCDHMAASVNYTGWKKGVYPARQDAEEGIRDGFLYLAEEDGEAIGSFILSRKQEEAYAGVEWQEELAERDVLTLYTFTVDPRRRGRGIGREMLAFAVRQGEAQGAKALRLDVYEKNLPAIRLYESAGFRYIDAVSLGLEDIGLDRFLLYEKLLHPAGKPGWMQN